MSICQKAGVLIMKKSPVEIGIEYENKVVEILNDCGLEAYKTNKANESDPDQYKAGFDGGVDIIAKYSVTVRKIYKDFVFYIQCKCWNGKELTKSAISEVYAGMHARGGASKGSIPVVFATSEASQETRQFAENLGVELILNRELTLISHARTTGSIVYANYGVLMKVILYHYTKDRELLETLPDTNSNVESMTWKEQVLSQTQMDLAMLQSEWDTIANQELKLQQKRQKTLDMTKIAVLRNVQTIDYSRNSHEKHVTGETPTIDMDSG